MFKRIFNGITYLLLFMCCVVLADFYKHPLFLFLLVLVITFVPISYFAANYAFKKLVFSIHFPVSYGHSGEDIVLSLNTTLRSYIVLPNCELTYHISSPFYPCDEMRKVIYPASPFQSMHFDLPIHFERAGVYEISLSHITTYDYLHIFRFDRNLSVRKELIIYPKQLEAPAFDRAVFGEGFDEFEETNAKGNVSSNVTDLREYIPGDRLQQIHWKLSAKVDKWMIKENESTATNQFTLLVELYLPTPESDFLEKSLSNAYSLAGAMVQAGEVFFFMAYSEKSHDFIQICIRCQEDLDAAFLQTFYQTTYQEEDLALHTLSNASIVHGIILHATHKGVSDVFS